MQVHGPSKSVILKLREPERVLSVIPQHRARLVQHGTHKLTQVRYGVDETRVLRNLGFDLPSPIRYFYDWPLRIPDAPGAKPFPHQITTAEFMTLNPRGAVLNDMGTGKTNSTLWCVDFLQKQKWLGKVIVACPKSVTSVWMTEVRAHFLGRLKAVVLTGTPKQRLEKLADKEADIYIINHDGLKIPQVFDALSKRRDIDGLVWDEADNLRNTGTAMWKAVRALAGEYKLLQLLTGTPTPKEPTDVWGYAKLLKSPGLPTTFTAFREALMTQVTMYKWVPKPGAYERALQYMQPAIRFKKTDVLKDLPPVTYITCTTEMTKQQEVAYEQMREHLRTEVAGTEITAAHAATKIIKLLQISQGIVYDSEGQEHMLDSTDRLAALDELIHQTDRKVLVFVPFIISLELVHRHLAKKHGADSVAMVYGKTGDRQRAETWRRFQDPHDDLRLIVAHPQVASHGLTLTEADLTVWYGPINDLRFFQQANNRMDRPGQKHAMTIALIASNQLELELYDALRKKQESQDTLLNLFKNALEAPRK